MNKFLGTLLNSPALTAFYPVCLSTGGPKHGVPRIQFAIVNASASAKRANGVPRAAVAAWFFVATAFAQASYKFDGPARLPDPSVTPGVVRTTITDEVCHTSTKQFRHTTAAMKAKAYAEYSQVDHKGVCAGAEGCEIDHLISLELGGADAAGNLWPQPYAEHPGAHEKDRVENYLHKQVCSGKMKLVDAQKAIATDWYKVLGTIQ